MTTNTRNDANSVLNNNQVKTKAKKSLLSLQPLRASAALESLNLFSQQYRPDNSKNEFPKDSLRTLGKFINGIEPFLNELHSINRFIESSMHLTELITTLLEALSINRDATNAK